MTGNQSSAGTWIATDTRLWQRTQRSSLVPWQGNKTFTLQNQPTAELSWSQQFSFGHKVALRCTCIGFNGIWKLLSCVTVARNCVFWKIHQPVLRSVITKFSIRSSSANSQYTAGLRSVRFGIGISFEEARSLAQATQSIPLLLTGNVIVATSRQNPISLHRMALSWCQWNKLWSVVVCRTSFVHQH